MGAREERDVVSRDLKWEEESVRQELQEGKC